MALLISREEGTNIRSPSIDQNYATLKISSRLFKNSDAPASSGKGCTQQPTEEENKVRERRSCCGAVHVLHPPTSLVPACSLLCPGQDDPEYKSNGLSALLCVRAARLFLASRWETGDLSRTGSRVSFIMFLCFCYLRFSLLVSKLAPRDL